jgi:hypothetical protein
MRRPAGGLQRRRRRPAAAGSPQTRPPRSPCRCAAGPSRRSAPRRCSCAPPRSCPSAPRAAPRRDHARPGSRADSLPRCGRSWASAPARRRCPRVPRVGPSRRGCTARRASRSWGLPAGAARRPTQYPLPPRLPMRSTSSAGGGVPQHPWLGFHTDKKNSIGQSGAGPQACAQQRTLRAPARSLWRRRPPRGASRASPPPQSSATSKCVRVNDFLFSHQQLMPCPSWDASGRPRNRPLRRGDAHP